MSVPSYPPPVPPAKPRGNLRRFLLRGLAVILPPVLTIVILVWIFRTVQEYVLEPINWGARYVAARAVMDVRTPGQLAARGKLPALPAPWLGRYRITKELADRVAKGLAPVPTKGEDGKDEDMDIVGAYGADIFVQTANGYYVPLPVWQTVADANGEANVPATATGIYQEYVKIKYLGTYAISTAALLVLLIGLYFLGRFLALGIGRAVWQRFESTMVFRLPLVKNVYGAVKQVTDFLLTEHQVQYNRVVAVEYPRQGIWSMAFVTGEGMHDVQAVIGEPVLRLIVPTSPAPMTGFTIMVPRSQVIDLNLTLDQAFQLCISCGVVVPPHQLEVLARKEERAVVPGAADIQAARQTMAGG